MCDLDLLHRKIRLLEKWMLLVDKRLLALERFKNKLQEEEEPVDGKQVNPLAKAKTILP